MPYLRKPPVGQIHTATLNPRDLRPKFRHPIDFLDTAYTASRTNQTRYSQPNRSSSRPNRSFTKPGFAPATFFVSSSRDR